MEPSIQLYTVLFYFAFYQCQPKDGFVVRASWDKTFIINNQLADMFSFHLKQVQQWCYREVQNSIHILIKWK